MTTVVSRLCRYPVKGLSVQDLDRVSVTAGECFPEDRRFGLLLGAHAPDTDPPGWRPKTHFLMLMRHARLAALKTEFDPATSTLTIRRNGRAVAQGTLTTVAGRSVIEQFMAAYMASEVPGSPRIVEMPGTPLTDVDQRVVSVINLASVRDLERVVGRSVDPLRFRANLYVDGLDRWQEVGWVGQTLAIGTARLTVIEPIQRCAATMVEPTTGQRDINLPRALQSGYGHCNCGVYGRVITGGDMAVGDPVEVV